MGWFSTFKTLIGISDIQTDAIPLTGTLMKDETETFPLMPANFLAGGTHCYETIQELKEIPISLLMVPMTALVGASAGTITRYVLETMPTPGDYSGAELQLFENFWSVDQGYDTSGGSGIDQTVDFFGDLPGTASDGDTVLVLDASDDPTVTSGWATYRAIEDIPGGMWLKTTSQEDQGGVDISTKIDKDGSVDFTADQSMGVNKLTSLKAGTNSADVTRKDQQILRDGSQSFTGDQSMAGKRLMNLASTTFPADAVRRDHILLRDGTQAMEEDLNLNANNIKNVAAPLSANDAVPRFWIENNFMGRDSAFQLYKSSGSPSNGVNISNHVAQLSTARNAGVGLIQVKLLNFTDPSNVVSKVKVKGTIMVRTQDETPVFINLLISDNALGNTVSQSTGVVVQAQPTVFHVEAVIDVSAVTSRSFYLAIQPEYDNCFTDGGFLEAFPIEYQA